MQRHWDEQELAEHWSLTSDEFELLTNRTERSRLGFAALLKFFQVEGRFPDVPKEIPTAALDYLAGQLGISPEVFSGYDLASRNAKRDRVQIRERLGFRQVTVDDARELTDWLRSEILPVDHQVEHLREAALDWCRGRRIEPPTPARMERIVRSALDAHEKAFFAAVHAQIPVSCRAAMDELLRTTARDECSPGGGVTPFAELRADPGRVSLESVLREIAKLERIASLGLPGDLFRDVPPKVLQKYRLRVASEQPREVRMHAEAVRHTLVAAFCWSRRKEIVDGLIDLLIQVVHRIGVRAEKKVVKTLLEDLRRVHGKATLPFKIAVASIGNPDGIIKEVVYPVVGEQTLHDLVREFQSTGPAYQKHVHTTLRSSYSNHYRRMLPPLLDALEFRSNNVVHRPVIDALELLKAHRESKQRSFPLDDGVPLDGVVRTKFREFVVETDPHGGERVNRINYEIAVLQALRERLRCKEIWVVGADRYRNPDDDLPTDFGANREAYYAELKQPRAAEDFVAGLKRSMAESLEQLNATLPGNSKVRIVERKKARISLTPVEPQPDPVNLAYLKAEITRRWPMTSLLDVLKETDLRVGFTEEFPSVSAREALDREDIQKRLLLSLYGLGTNTGLKRVSASDSDITYKDLLYVRRKFVQKDSLRRAIARVANAIFRVRLPEVWGEGTTACASDSKKFGAWDQNLMTEWHIRYGGRGVMIYWHVEKKAVCIYSQLKRCSSSEVAAMIEGVMRHCTEMSVEKNYVDSHGQSDVAFAFCHLLGFELLPRLKGLAKKKLYRVQPGRPEDYPNLQPILSRPINWDLIANQYDEMVKYATALRLGTAQTEAILRRFTRENLKHPTYQALLELGKVKRTIFLCRYLQSEELRQEIQDALNVVERWNGTNGFIFFGKGGEVATKGYNRMSLTGG
jgi:TnpA family transposase